MSSKAQLILALALGVAQSCEFASFIISGGGCGGTAASLGIFETASLCAEAAYATPACAEGLATMPAYIEFDSVTGGCGCCDPGKRRSQTRSDTQPLVMQANNSAKGTF